MKLYKIDAILRELIKIMRYPILVILGFSLFATISLSGQQSVLQKFQDNKLRHIDVPTKSSDFFSVNNKSLGLTEDDHMIQVKKWTDRSGITRHRYTQSYRNLPVIGSAYTLHSNNGAVYKATGNLFPNIDLSITPSFTKKELEEKASIILESYLTYQKVIMLSKDIEWKSNYDQLCIIDQTYPDISGNYRLAHAYKITTEDYNFPINYTVYMDAHTGKFIDAYTNIKCGDSKGVAHTRYYGKQEINTDSISPDLFLLRDNTRGNGVITYDYDNRDEPVSDNDNVWDNNKDGNLSAAGDAHYCSGEYYDMMMEYFNWDGLDGEGGELISIVNVFDRYYVNAFWDGTSTYYGNGDCHRYGPLTTLTVVGHEFAHGWTDYTSDLVYRNESGALNESISDIIGKGLEYYSDIENFTWKIGDHIRKNEEIRIFRSMSDPNERNHPKYYAGDNWRTGTADRGGVHSNSGVFNHWFYLLVEGGTGQNEAGVSYNVGRIGMRSALDVVFHTQTGYLTPSSNYFDCMYYTLEVAEELYGQESSEYDSVLEAWKAVGLYPGIDDFDLSVYISSDDPIVLCPGEEKYVQVIVKNSGTKTIESGINFSIAFDQKLLPEKEETVIIDRNLPVGDSIIYTFDTPIVNDVDKDGTFYVYIEDIDINTLNNITIGSLRISEVEGLDISVERFDLIPSEECGSQTVSRYSYGLRNTGCEVIPDGEILVFDIVTDKGNFSVERPLFADLQPGSFVGSAGSLVSDVPEGISDFKATLSFENDINADNNTSSDVVLFPQSIEQGYREDFEKVLDDVPYMISLIDKYNHDTIVEYYGNQLLAFSSTTEVLTVDDCNDPIGYFDGYDRSAELTFCIDAGDMEQPIFSFDLIQILNEDRRYDLPVEAFGAMVRVETRDSIHPIIYGQQSGAMINHDISLPPNYSGELTIEIITAFASSTEGSYLDNRDIVMFDDFKLYSNDDISLQTDELGYTIFPNPTADLIRVYNKDADRIFDLYVHDQLGREFAVKKSNVNQGWIDLSAIPTGVYNILIVEYGNIVSTQRVVKF